MLTEACDLLTAPTPDGWDRLLAALNPERLPPAVPPAVARAAWEDAWHPEELPRSWITDLRRSDATPERQAGVATLALAVAAAKGPHCDPDLPRKLLTDGLHWLGEPVADRPNWHLTPRRVVRDAEAVLQGVGLEWAWRAKCITDGWPLGWYSRSVPDQDWVPSDLGVPTVCPYARILPLDDGLDELESRLRQEVKIRERQSIHWVGGAGCWCPILRPVGEEQTPEAAAAQDLYRLVTRLLRASADDVPRLTRKCREQCLSISWPTLPDTDWELVRGAAAGRVTALDGPDWWRPTATRC